MFNNLLLFIILYFGVYVSGSPGLSGGGIFFIFLIKLTSIYYFLFWVYVLGSPGQSGGGVGGAGEGPDAAGEVHGHLHAELPTADVQVPALCGRGEDIQRQVHLLRQWQEVH